MHLHFPARRSVANNITVILFSCLARDTFVKRQREARSKTERLTFLSPPEFSARPSKDKWWRREAERYYKQSYEIRDKDKSIGKISLRKKLMEKERGRMLV